MKKLGGAVEHLPAAAWGHSCSISAECCSATSAACTVYCKVMCTYMFKRGSWLAVCLDQACERKMVLPWRPASRPPVSSAHRAAKQMHERCSCRTVVMRGRWDGSHHHASMLTPDCWTLASCAAYLCNFLLLLVLQRCCCSLLVSSTNIMHDHHCGLPCMR